MHSCKPLVAGRCRGSKLIGMRHTVQASLQRAECIALWQQHQQPIQTLHQVMTVLNVQQLQPQVCNTHGGVAQSLAAFVA